MAYGYSNSYTTNISGWLSYSNVLVTDVVRERHQ